MTVLNFIINEPVCRCCLLGKTFKNVSNSALADGEVANIAKIFGHALEWNILTCMQIGNGSFYIWAIADGRVNTGWERRLCLIAA
jgi:hypothetical protein